MVLSEKPVRLVCDVCRQSRICMSYSLQHAGHPVRESHICHDCGTQGVRVSFEVPVAIQDARGRAIVHESRRLEQVLADDMKARTQPASGATRSGSYKGDVRKLGGWLVQHKFTDSLSTWTLRLADVTQVIREATDVHELPLLVVEFRRLRERLAILPFNILEELTDGFTVPHS